jgi:hypothetical protein
MTHGRRLLTTPGMRATRWGVGAVLALALGGPAVASGDSLRIKMPRSVPTGGYVTIAASGFASGPRILLVYLVDKKRCAATAKQEDTHEKRGSSTRGARGSVRNGRTTRQLNGPFSLFSVGGGTPVRDPGYMCAYLTDGGDVINDNGTIDVRTPGSTTAHAFAHYRLRRCRHWFGKPFRSACRDRA